MAKKRFFLGLVLAVGFVLVSCAVTRPVIYSPVGHIKNFVILGEVTWKPNVVISSQQQGFLDFWDAVKKQYPDADYVIDVMVDTREGRRLIFFKRYEYRYRGTAIQYVK